MKTASICFIFAGIIIFAGIFTGEYFFKGYSQRNNTISDLGQRIDPVNTSIVSSIIFFFFLIIGGATIVFGGYLLYSNLNNKFISVLLIMHGIATMGVGIFNTNIKPIHLIFAVLTFLTVEIAAISSYNLTNNSLKYLLSSLGLISIIFLIGNFGFKSLLGVGGAERFIVYPTTLWLIIFGLFLFSHKTT